MHTSAHRCAAGLADAVIIWPPADWSEEEALLRTGTWSGMGPDVWQKTELGGSDTYRQLRHYTADYHSFGSKVRSPAGLQNIASAARDGQIRVHNPQVA